MLNYLCQILNGRFIFSKLYILMFLYRKIYIFIICLNLHINYKL